MERLAHKRCPACTPQTERLSAEELSNWSSKVVGWAIIESHHLEKSFSFPDFLSALAFVNAIAPVAESEGHHPDLFLAWGKVTVQIFTHTVGGLQSGDFILADKIDLVREELGGGK